ncbi:MAG TPA: hypothetical protein VKZ59_09390 [Acidobacteriota bacterium]|nr:hypothetical protein [Acidobacteriota bacterium]
MRPRFDPLDPGYSESFQSYIDDSEEFGFQQRKEAQIRRAHHERRLRAAEAVAKIIRTLPADKAAGDIISKIESGEIPFLTINP